MPSDARPPAQGAAGTARRRLVAYLSVSFLSSLGSAAALLGSTIVSSDAGSSGGLAATYTALMLALGFGAASLATPYAGVLAHRFGTRRVSWVSTGFVVVAYAVLSILIWAGVPGFPALIAVTPVIGAAGGIGHVVGPPVVVAYCAGQELSRAEGWTSMASGLAWVIGGVVGGVLIDAVGAPVAFLLNVVLSVPLVLMVALVPPTVPIDEPAAQPRPWRSMLDSLRTNTRLIRACAFGIATAILVGPFVSMVVPITREAGHDLAIHAGLILAAASLGAVISPLPLRRVGTRHGPLRAASILGLACGVILVALAAVISLYNGTPQLIGVLAFAVVFGAAQASSGNLLIQDAAASAADGAHQQQDLAAYFLFAGLGTPIGSLLWANLARTSGVPWLLAYVGLATVVVAVLMILLLNRLGIHRAPALAPTPHGHPTPPHATHRL